ncbi:MAG: helix-hairpin-helix domain-containing protein [Burkholderiales bacterium]|nr:helix-hairpin-helix domain-containing protein [Burkholderiales bacterium]
MFRQLIVAVLAALALNAFAAVDINRATRAELETVSGVGPGLSAKILKAREAGEFKDWADMVQRVPGVGPASAGKLSKAGLTVGGASFDASQMPPAAPKQARQRKAAGEAAAGSEAGAKPARKAARKEKVES